MPRPIASIIVTVLICAGMLSLALAFKTALWHGAGMEFDLASLSHHRRLVETAAETAAMCDNDFDRSGAPALVVYLLVTLLIFFGMYALVEEYLVHSIGMICTKLGLSEDVAGATFMAAGSSAPELLANFVDAFWLENNIGSGTIVGSAVFNVLFGVAVGALVIPKHKPLDWRPIVRDLTFYLVSLVEVLMIFADGHVYWGESLVLVLTYVGYVVMLMYNETIFAKLPCCARPSDLEKTVQCEVELEDMACTAPPTTIHGASPAEKEVEVAEEKEKEVQEGETSDDSADAVMASAVEASDAGSPVRPAHPVWRCGVLICRYLLAPWAFLFAWTVPDCREERWRPWYMLTFSVCIAWVMLLTWLLVFCGTAIGCIANVHPALLGVTLMAVGTSLPDAFGSISASKRGSGGMAVANALGSNIFDVCFALGFPWLLHSMVFPEQTIVVSRRDLVVPVVLQVIMGLILLALLYVDKWFLTKRAGVIMLMLYVCFLIFEIVKAAYQPV